MCRHHVKQYISTCHKPSRRLVGVWLQDSCQGTRGCCVAGKMQQVLVGVTLYLPSWLTADPASSTRAESSAAVNTITTHASDRT